jgi:predicted nucleotide-binding protein (sugar kinase/HSP70/actin superfamily)
VPGGLSPLEVFTAFEETEREQEKGRRALRDVYRREAARGDGFHVVLLGRPYTVLSRWMNKGIPETFASLGVRVFYQDMLPSSGEALEAIAPLLEDVHWHYAARILEAAQITALRPGAYPVLVTSFRCSPDSFVTTYFRQILEAQDKPHLVLELDEHDSRLGYETRIEAAVRAFRNHHEEAPSRARIPGGSSAAGDRGLRSLPLVSSHREVELEGRTLYFPNWDSTSLRLLVAAVRRTGLDARLLEASEGSVRRSLRHNSGQCTPLSIIAQDFMETVKAQGVDPDRAVLWMMASNVACNIHLFPHHIRTILKTHGQGFEGARVYAGGISLQDIAATLPLDGYLAYMFGGFLRRMGCRIRPREATPGATDGILEESLLRLEEAFETGESKEAALGEVIAGFREIPVETGGGESQRPKVAIFGDLYARDNRVLNQDLVHFIEAHGGEVITTPYTSYLKMVARPYYWKWFLEGKYLDVVTAGVWMTALTRLEKRYFRYFESVLGEEEPAYDVSPRSILSEYNVRVEHSGESMDNLLKVFYVTRHHPDVALFVQVSPAYCCPSLVTEAMTREIQEKTGVPVVSVTYDGTGGGKNDVILPYLEHARRRWTA